MLGAISVIIGFLFAFVLLPWLVLPRPRSAKNKLDVIVINFLRWLAIVVAGVQVLAFLRLYETTTIVVGCLIGIWFSKLRPRGWRLASAGAIFHRGSMRLARLADRAEHGYLRVGGARRSATERGRSAGASAGSAVAAGAAGSGGGVATVEREPAPWEHRPPRHKRVPWPRRAARLLPAALLVIPILVVLAIAAYLRFELPLAHAALSPGDDYVHMTWALQLQSNILFPNGIYPMGMASVLSFVSKWSIGASMSQVVQVMGPITGTLMILGIFYTSLRLTRNAGAAIFASATFGLFGMRAEWHEPWSRQTGALPQELAIGMGLFALGIVGLCVASRNKDHLWTIFAATVAMGMTHPLPLVLFLLLGGILAVVVGITTRHLAIGVQSVLIAVLGSAVGFLYIPLALLAGKPFYSGVSNINPFAGHHPSKAALTTTVGSSLGQNLMTHWALVSVLIGALGGIILLWSGKTRTRGATLLGISAVGGALLALYDPRFLGFSTFYAVRATNIVGPELALTFACGLGALGVIFRKFNLATAAVTLAAGLVMIPIFANYFPQTPISEQYIEYSSTATQTLNIMGSHTSLTYTIVGTPEQRQRSVGRSYFVELWVFARDIRLQDAENVGYQIPIPTNDIYITVEKHPFPVQPLAPSDATSEYYRNYDKRGRIMAITYQWCETYMRYHTNMSVYYNGRNVEIFHIHQVANAGIAQYSSQFKNYKWIPGKLFNTGPTQPLEMKIP